jgi:BatD DUF11 like domain/Domain of unknown function (DUF4381)
MMPVESRRTRRNRAHIGGWRVAWVLCLWGLFIPTWGEELPKVAISSQADRTEITIGDLLHYSIQVKYPKDGRIHLPSVLGNLGAFEVKDYSEGEAKINGDQKEQIWEFTLSTFTVGDYTLPPQWVEYRQGQDTTAYTYMTQPIAIKVKRTSPETVKDIADIAGPESPAVRRPWWLLLALVFLGTAVFLLWKLRKSKPATAAQAAPLVPPFEEAMAALVALNGVQAIRQNKSREWCFSLSLILRRYVSRRFGVDALESTSDEFIQLAAGLPLSFGQKPFIPRFCAMTDPVKFANVVLLESEAGQLVDDVRRFLEATRPAPESEEKAPVKREAKT